MRKRCVIVGTGVAGVMAAQELRRINRSERLEITMVSREVPPDYARVRLPEFIAGAASKEELVVHRPEWFLERGINVLCPAEVVLLDRARKRLAVLLLDDAVTPPSAGRRMYLHYDALILATGSLPFAPQLPPSGSAAFGGVFTLRTLDDAVAIKKRVALHSRSVAVMGGGLLGLEVARALRKSGVQDVHVLESAPYLLPRQLDKTASAMLESYLASEGLSVHTGVSVDVAELATRSVSDVLVNVCGGGVQTLIYSVGVRSETRLAFAAGLDCNRAIVINDETATSDQDIFAAGDCAEFRGVTWGIVPAALEQGRKAAQFASHRMFRSQPRPEPYVQTVPRTTLSVGSMEAASAGLAVLTPEQELSGKWRIHADTVSDGSSGDTYVRLVEDSTTGNVTGGLAFGPRGTAHLWLPRIQRAIGNHVVPF